MKLALLLTTFATGSLAQNDFSDYVFGLAKDRYSALEFADTTNATAGVFPHHTVDSNSWQLEYKKTWIDGFLPGIYWRLYQKTGDIQFKAKAIQTQEALRFRAAENDTHDLGFIFINSFGLARSIELASTSKNETFIKDCESILITAATSLASRFISKIGAIRSWNSKREDPQNGVKVIIDNMMNLELLYVASTLPGGKKEWADIATKHAETTMKSHVRENKSTYHLVVFDEATGSSTRKMTFQGYQYESTWSRGQAWGIYGFTSAYRYTKNPAFLDTAVQLADYYFSRLGETMIPKWDFDYPGNPANLTIQDSSASAIVNSGLNLLIKELQAAGRTSESIKFASLQTKVSDYLNTRRKDYFEGQGLVSILQHGTSFYLRGRSDHGLIYGDYYMLESLMPEATASVSANRVPSSSKTIEVIYTTLLLLSLYYAFNV